MQWLKGGVEFVKGLFNNEAEEQDTEEQSSELPPGRFASKRVVAVPQQPLLVNAGYTPAPVQGLSWYVKQLWQNGQGDIANVFLRETGSDTKPELRAQRHRLQPVKDCLLLLHEGSVHVLPKY
jgi:hypothetical protein